MTTDTPKEITITDTARLCHEVNRAYCDILGDNSQVNWYYAESWQRKSAVDGVLAHLKTLREGKTPLPSDSHENWYNLKAAEGWIYGECKDTTLKTHPCMVPYAELPAEQKVKDDLFVGIVTSLYARGLLK